MPEKGSFYVPEKPVQKDEEETLDVRFNGRLTEEDLQRWGNYFWCMGQNFPTLLIDRGQERDLVMDQARSMNKGKSIHDRRTRGGKFLHQYDVNYYNHRGRHWIKVYETDTGMFRFTISKPIDETKY